MQPTSSATRVWVLHPFHAAVLGGLWPLFLGTLLSDYAYWSSHEIQWANFAAWLLAGAMVVTTLALVGGLIGLARGSRAFFHVAALVVTWCVGLLGSLHHARDAWAIMPAALVWSAAALFFALLATWAGFSSLRDGGAR
jgi:uncharacterized membrane protein (UPF0136 family)